MPNSNIILSYLYKVLANASIDNQGKNFEEVLYVAKHAQSTDSIRIQLKISELFMQICS